MWFQVDSKFNGTWKSGGLSNTNVERWVSVSKISASIFLIYLFLIFVTAKIYKKGKDTKIWGKRFLDSKITDQLSHQFIK